VRCRKIFGFISLLEWLALGDDLSGFTVKSVAVATVNEKRITEHAPGKTS
jgi:hypothetical protein